MLLHTSWFLLITLADPMIYATKLSFEPVNVEVYLSYGKFYRPLYASDYNSYQNVFLSTTGQWTP